MQPIIIYCLVSINSHPLIFSINHFFFPNSSTPSSMAPEKDPQQFIDASISKRKGKETADPVTKKRKDDNLARFQLAADIPESSSKIESSSESEVEDEEEGLDEWEKEARRMFPPREATNGWRPWTIQELTIIEMEYMASMLDFVPFTGELNEDELGPEVEFDMRYGEEDDIDEVATAEVDPDQQIIEQGIEESDSAQPPQEPQEIDQVAPSADGAAMVDALNVAADPSSPSIPPSK